MTDIIEDARKGNRRYIKDYYEKHDEMIVFLQEDLRRNENRTERLTWKNRPGT